MTTLQPIIEGEPGAQPNPLIMSRTIAGKHVGNANNNDLLRTVNFEAEDKDEKIEAMKRVTAHIEIWKYKESKEPDGTVIPRTEHITDASGFFIHNNYLITAAHVVEIASGPQDHLRIKDSANRVYIARVVHSDARRDFAILEIEGDAHGSTTIGDSDTVKQGDTVYVAGSPAGQSESIFPVTVSRLPKPGEIPRRYKHMSPIVPGDNLGDGFIQTVPEIIGGNSGGPVFNKVGKVIGIAVGTIGGPGLVIAANEFRALAEHTELFITISSAIRLAREVKDDKTSVPSLERGVSNAINNSLKVFASILFGFNTKFNYAKGHLHPAVSKSVQCYFQG